MHPKFFSILLAIALPLSSAAPCLAQGDAAIHGTVKAQADRSALPGAIVELQGAALSAPMKTTTTTDGRFSFPRLVPGVYALTITHGNFQETRYQLSLKPREVQNLELALVLRPVQELVEVTAGSLPSVYSPGSTH